LLRIFSSSHFGTFHFSQQGTSATAIIYFCPIQWVGPPRGVLPVQFHFTALLIPEKNIRSTDCFTILVYSVPLTRLKGFPFRLLSYPCLPLQRTSFLPARQRQIPASLCFITVLIRLWVRPKPFFYPLSFIFVLFLFPLFPWVAFFHRTVNCL